MNKRLYLLNTLTATLLFSGCMGYQLGGSRPDGIEAVTMGAVQNRTSEPAIELQVTHDMRQRIQFDGRMKLVNEPKNADAVINIKLTKYELSPIAFRADQSTTPDLYRMRITGEAELVNRETGDVISKSTNYGESTFRFEDDLTSSKRDALNAATDELSRLLLDDLIERW